MVSVTFIISTLAVAALTVAGVDAVPKIDARVHRALKKAGSVNIMITMAESTEAVLESVQESEFTTRGAWIENMVGNLENHAEVSQKSVLEVLNQEAFSGLGRVETYWISNQVFIENATPELIMKLAAIPNIVEIAEETIYEIQPVEFVEADNSTVNPVEWGVERIQAPTLWASGNTGENVIVANIDTGVRGTHEVLKNNFRGDYGWFDPEKKADAPYDGNGHGSHTMGTIAGANGVGVAPGAKWMACKGCRSFSCPQSDLLACFQFMTCPTDTQGNNKDCTKAPHVINNSWGGGQGSIQFKSSIDVLQMAGIIPIFSNGNSGPSCETANSPADLTNVIAVGASDINEALASFSSKGPSVGGLTKPDVTAPGVNIRSAWNAADAEYKAISGTSMASPHTTGTVALLLSANPSLTYDEVKELLQNSAITSELKSTGYTCGGTADDTFPNNQYGYGRIDALKSVRG